MDPTSPRRHIIIPGAADAHAYRRPSRDMSGMAGPPAPSDRRAHGRRLQEALAAVPDRHRESVEAAGLGPEDLIDAYYLTFRVDTVIRAEWIKSLSPRERTSGIRVIAMHEVEDKDTSSLFEITVFVPAHQLHQFQRKVAAYLDTVDRNAPRLKEQIDRWQSIDLASIQQFWTDRSPFPANDQSIWWEVWLRHEGEDEAALANLRTYCQRFGITLADKALVIDDRLVTLARATLAQWSAAPLIVAYLAEFRRARELATPFLDMPNREQRQWAEDLADRLLQMGADLPAVCVVDSGVNRAHALLEASLVEADQHACEAAWGVDDVADQAFVGHGTGMAGLALLGEELPDLLLSQDQVELRHKLESVKVLPRSDGNAPELHAVRTVEATTGPETAVPERRRVSVLALTAADSEASGEPSLWAATIDALAAGRSIYPDASTERLEQLTSHPDPTDARLWVVASGNVRAGYTEDHLALCDRHAVENPAEAWNALTVGAMTDRCDVKHPTQNERPLARVRGDLSPLSRTSVPFDVDRPIKPEIVMEGGNAHVDDNGDVAVGHDELSLLTTSHNLMFEQFRLFSGTSAASALAARMAARIWAEYPRLWPETVRGLMVHAARWTPAMVRQFDPYHRKADRIRLLRRYGWGMPEESLALRCLGHKLTLICQDRFQPFQEGRYHQMCLHRLPWPMATLEALGEQQVHLRVTLSTFIDPHPSRRGRYGYPSHQLRFALKPPTEDPDRFLARINQAAREDGYQSTGSPSDDRWFFGSDARTRGSICSDIWSGPAADLAARSELAVWPVSGWWKDKEVDRPVRYALLISIETEQQDVDLWTEVMQAVEAAGIDIELDT